VKIVVINQKVAFVRHWFKWYRVLRAGEDWRELAIGQKYQKPFDLKNASKKLENQYGAPGIHSILDEHEADKIVAKNIKKSRIKSVDSN
jgi:hypothetical protein